MAAARHHRFLSAWFCPFAHRAHIALELTGVPYEFVDSLGWTLRGEEWHHWKSPELLAANPRGTIPVLLPERGRAVYESQVCLEYLHDLNPEASTLLPSDSFGRARQRTVSEFVNRRICSPYYDILVKRGTSERKASFQELLASLRKFSSQTVGPFFAGDELTMVDIMAFPHCFRFFVLEHYRGPAFAVPTDEEELQPFHRWLKAMTQHPSVAPTLPDKQRYLDHVRKYADATARSKVANAVRGGRAAHDMDDED
uniref:Glutathione transferase n=1 Tax=Rhizochromulina marina TaxID=1034831 RepID=A0A7S2ST00_9STRA|mmetsp:Transcript_5937/g.17339  ORF Transcript_5937/g.17339 Transcript_5937/m.17339 type:complete len:255 (+) Transcript_5937:77-841(+)